MDDAAVLRYITETFDGLEVISANGDTFIFYDPERKLPHDRRLPIVTIVTGDRHDRASNLDRNGVFRLNVGVTKEAYRRLFGDPPPMPKTPDGVAETGHDYTTLDRLMPHPVYAAMSWVCVLNPSEQTFREQVVPLLAAAHRVAKTRHEKRAEAPE